MRTLSTQSTTGKSKPTSSSLSSTIYVSLLPRNERRGGCKRDAGHVSSRTLPNSTLLQRARRETETRGLGKYFKANYVCTVSDVGNAICTTRKRWLLLILSHSLYIPPGQKKRYRCYVYRVELFVNRSERSRHYYCIIADRLRWCDRHVITILVWHCDSNFGDRVLMMTICFHLLVLS